MQFRKSSAAMALVAGLGGLLGVTPALALVTIAADNFDSYGVGALNGKNGGTGWGGAWVDAGTTNSNVVATVGADSPMSGNAVRITGINDAVATRALADALSGNIIVRFDFQFDAGNVTDNDFLGLWFGGIGGPNIGLKANCGGPPNACTYDIFARTSGNDAGGNIQDIAIGQSYSIMGYLQKTGVSTVYNRFDLWVDPTASEIATLTGADASDTGASSISSFSQIGFRTFALGAAGTVDALLIDNLSLSRVPEPGTLALFGLALAGIAVTSRRRTV